MSQSEVGRACGKVILFGDHFVVHDVPALSLPIPDLFCEVQVSKSSINQFEFAGAKYNAKSIGRFNLNDYFGIF